MNVERLGILGAALIALALAGCVQRTAAPVTDRAPPPVAKPAAPAAPAAPTAQPDTYVVKRGDTLYSIALDQGVDWRDLAAWNQLADPTRLQLGQVLRVRPPAVALAGEGAVASPIGTSQPIVSRPLGGEGPGTAPTVPQPPGAPAGPLLKTEPKGLRLPYSDENLALVQRGDAARVAVAPKPEAPPAMTPPKPDAAPAPKPEPQAAVKPEPSAAAKPEPDPAGERVEWAWPAGGKVVTTFDGASRKGVDIAGRLGDPVYASAAGKVVYSGEGIPAYGKLVIIRHNATYLSAYAHNSQILVKEGQNVAKGQKIAEVGTTGADQPKLHFEIRRLGKPVDPLSYLPNRTN
jgi:lipoprotein NlpD